MDVMCLLKLRFDVPALSELEETNLKFQELSYVKPFGLVPTYERDVSIFRIKQCKLEALLPPPTPSPRNVGKRLPMDAV